MDIGIPEADDRVTEDSLNDDDAEPPCQDDRADDMNGELQFVGWKEPFVEEENRHFCKSDAGGIDYGAGEGDLTR